MKTKHKIVRANKLSPRNSNRVTVLKVTQLTPVQGQEPSMRDSGADDSPSEERDQLDR
jgi:hypothetical protein